METTNPRDTRRSQPADALGPELLLQPDTPSAQPEAQGGVWSPAMPAMALAAANPELAGVRRQAWLRKGIPELASPLAG